MLQAANTHNRVKIYYFLYEIGHKSHFEANWLISIFCTLGTDGLRKVKSEFSSHLKPELGTFGIFEFFH